VFEIKIRCPDCDAETELYAAGEDAVELVTQWLFWHVCEPDMVGAAVDEARDQAKSFC